MSIWILMIIFHAIAALVCLASGMAITSPDRAKRHIWLFPTFIISLIGMLVFMIAAIISHWHEISVMERFIFSGLVVLGVYMLFRANSAKKQLQKGTVPEKYIDDVGFTLISLFNGFTVVTLIDLRAPIWVIVAVAILAVLVGGKLLGSVKYRYVQSLDVASREM